MDHQTEPNSLSHSPRNSQVLLPANPADSIQPVAFAFENNAVQDQITKDIDEVTNNIRVSPSWDKNTSRKEKRATRRLEAERQELEKRLLHLDEAQARLDSGVYDRNSRRLTKKQPSSRSSSVSAAQTRSSSGPFSSLFSNFRRSSRSRSNSVNGGDRSLARHLSADVSSEMPSGPPYLALTLPERFGAAITRELESRQSSFMMNQAPSSHCQRTLHTITKVDDLRENWKAAQAWQSRNVSVHEASREVSGKGNDDKDASGHPSQNRGASPVTKLAANLDSELSVAALRHERRAPGVGFMDSSIPSETSSSRASLQPSTKTAQVNSSQDVHLEPGPSSKVTTPQQFYKRGSSESEKSSLAENALSSSNSVNGNHVSHRGQIEAGPHGYQRIYKSSPLAASPTTTENIDRNETATKRVSVVQKQSPRFSTSFQNEEYRGRSPRPVSSNHTYETSSQTEAIQNEIGHPPPQLPIKNSRRQHNYWHQRDSSFDHLQQHRDGTTPRSSNQIKANASEIPKIWVNGEGKSKVPGSMTNGTPRRRTANENSWEESFRRDHHGPNKTRSRSSSLNSSRSDYDTADEEAPDSSKSDPRAVQTRAPDTQSQSPAPGTSMANGHPVIQHSGLLSPRNGPANVLRRESIQKLKAQQKGQVVAKVFVICCKCRYWHDMPSEVYSKLACPDRLLTGSRSGHFSRRTEPSVSPSHTKLPVSRKVQPFSDLPGSPAPPLRSSPLSEPSGLQCCWCGHTMGKKCCQGWTTIVQMHERHH
ncbi:hypothetical protein N7474_010520 [Penicillium riverlandense]|uniref:uncharacterized protein n=1 Tax=Penicillium riverlandense TaxID=1903569 RepID=UPI0025490A3A|nr:uncharacterized protein N7474_010520 [Penicillium riverlandense]KAJ5806928.1 hypothetical protein N7474_010520 [Penicillium riverlandense]